MKKDKKSCMPPAAAVFLGIVTAVLITLTVLVICAAVMTATGGINESAVNLTVYITSAAAVFAGGLTAAARLDKKGLMTGVAVGVLYTLIMLFVGFMVTPGFGIGTKSLLTLLFAALGGAAGGAIGINM